MEQKYIAYAVIWVILAGLLIQPAQATQIGCELYEPGVIKCWNNGSIEPVTYISTNGMQFANNLTERFNWTTYEIGFFYNDSGGNIQKYPISFSPTNLKYSSDNETFWKLEWRGKLIQGIFRINGTWTMYQYLNDDKVTMIPRATFKNFNSFPYEIGLYVWMKDIDIWNDDEVDVLSAIHNGLGMGFYLNETDLLYSDNLTRGMNIGDMASGKGIQWDFLNQTYEGYYIPKPAQTNGEVVFFKTAKRPYSNEFTKQLTFRWIDVDPCVWSCARGCYMATAMNTSSIGYVGQQGCSDPYQRAMKWYYTGSACGIGGCTYSGICTLRLQEYYPSAFVNIPSTGNYQYPLNCQDYSCTKSSPVQNLWYTRYFIGGRAPGNVWVRSYWGDGTTYVTSVFNGVMGVIECNERNITLTGPSNYFNATEGDTISFTCTRESYWTDWLALYINNTVYYNITSMGFSNLSHDVTLNDTGIYEWDCRGYTYGNSTESWSWNGNYTINISELILNIININNFKYYFIDKSYWR